MTAFFDGFAASEKATKDSICIKRVYIDINDKNLIDGVMFSQIMYWHLPPNKSKKKTRLTIQKEGEYWLAKNYDDWWEECRVKSRAARDSINRMVKRGLLIKKIWHFGGKKMSHIRIDKLAFERALKALDEEPVSDEIGQIPKYKYRGVSDEIGQMHLTKSVRYKGSILRNRSDAYIQRLLTETTNRDKDSSTAVAAELLDLMPDDLDAPAPPLVDLPGIDARAVKRFVPAAEVVERGVEQA